MPDGNSTARVAAALREDALSQRAGTRLPSVRELMASHGVGPGTVQQALAQLKRECLISAQPGQGTFVAERPASPPARDLSWQSVSLGTQRSSSGALAELLAIPPAGALTLSTGYLPLDLQPARLLASALGRAARRPGVWDRIPVEGLEPLRAWFAQDLGAGMSAHDVIICPGTQAGLACAFRALAPPGASVLVESPSYIGAFAAARAADLNITAVPCDADGVRPELLDDALRSTGARLFYGQPLYANPHGSVLSPTRRGQILSLLHQHGAFMIEDDWARDLSLERKPPTPLATEDDHGHIVYVRSLSKPAAPGLRIGALAARGPAAARLRAARVVEDFFVAGPLQDAALEVVTSPAWRRHLRSLAATLRLRRDALVASVERHLPAAVIPIIPRGGLHLWIQLSKGTDDEELAQMALRAGVLVSAGRHWFPTEPPGSFLRLTYAAAQPAELEAATQKLAGLTSLRLEA
jgi:DNA-binding transcriptional MocR family regulator